MKYRILKMAVVIGLVASSSLAVAEGKFSFRQPLSGVDGQEYYGMSQTQIDDAIVEQERLAQIEADKAMCLNESTWMEEVTKIRYVNETRYRTEYRDVPETRTRTKYRDVTAWTNRTTRFEPNKSGVSQQSGGAYCYQWEQYSNQGCTTSPYKVNGDYRYSRGSYQGNYITYKWSIVRETRTTVSEPYEESYTVYVSEPYQEAYTVQVPEEHQDTIQAKSENYDYCVNNGYQTAN